MGHSIERVDELVEVHQHTISLLVKSEEEFFSYSSEDREVYFETIRALLETVDISNKEDIYEKTFGWAKKDSSSLTSKDFDEIKVLTEAIRLQLTSLTLFGNTDCSLDIFRCIEESENAALITWSGKVVSAHTKSRILILLPRIVKTEKLLPSDLDEVISDLFQILEKSPIAITWVLDFSSITNLTTLSLASIFGIRSILDAKKIKLLIAWLSPGQISERDMSRISSTYNLTKVGNYWFSSPSGA